MARNRLVRPVGIVLALLVVLAFGVALGDRLATSRTADENTVRLSATDIGYAQDMSVHHEQAIQLANTLTRDCDPQVRVLADRISAAQTAEIATMRGWLGLLELPFVPAHPMQWLDDDEPHDHGGATPMPGMASVDEITRLSTLRGAEAEVLFLQLMIRHHQGGIAMARSAVDLVDSEPIRRLARLLVADQGNEIGVMTAMLTVRGATPLSYP
ncbi:DUF305 domain-containing protein [Antrihabitans stalagmiti]|uniref:DUF305 domain-containing protein n=1 Tax=Antrihabitans stalagmiti TaxID=2799499 RepID=UPI001F1AC5A3|nr:DUF305 domain-containing protein [Antrihabitans stalagmiti]